MVAIDESDEKRGPLSVSTPTYEAKRSVSADSVTTGSAYDSRCRPRRKPSKMPLLAVEKMRITELETILAQRHQQ